MLAKYKLNTTNDGIDQHHATVMDPKTIAVNGWWWTI